MNTCPLFEKCGGCKFDFTAPDYRDKKSALLKNTPLSGAPMWCALGQRRRADFSFANGKFGFFAAHSKDIVPITDCPLLSPGLNKILPRIAALPWIASGSALLTECENGIDLAVSSAVPYFSPDFAAAVAKTGLIRASWNNRVIFESARPIVQFDDVAVDYPVGGAFLQPSKESETILRDLVVGSVGLYETDIKCDSRRESPHQKTADLFCGLGSFTFALKADGYDIQTDLRTRDLFKKPLNARELAKYDCVVLDPPRAGCEAQCRELARSAVQRIIYASCNPESFARDMGILSRGGFNLKDLTAVDQFVGTTHWELVGVFDR
ncbi:MAG: hypothetical protein LBJ18_00790 [Rickettsiales bacterium]|jgi:23S rRNA (uracil1939-C5)-methyltransferase|nr:hypothetical protein [Rickettsiales bacterium]